MLANGGLGALIAVSFALFGEQNWQWIAFAGAMAAVNADTWATELGMLSTKPPRLITNGKVVERGSSGGVSLWGYSAGLGGALFIGVGAGVFSGMDGSFLIILVIVTTAGLLGATFDSLLGATVQAIYFCPGCRKVTERHPWHFCGTETTQTRGWKWLNNDVVNLACSIIGAATAVGLWSLFA